MKTSIRWASGQRNLLEELGIDIERCFSEAGINRDQSTNSSTFIDKKLLRRFYASCLAAYGDPYLGILMGEHFSLNYSGYLGHALMSAPTHGDAIQLSLDFPYVTGLEFRYAKKVMKDEFALTLVWDENDRGQLFEFLCNLNVAGLYKAGREIVDGPVELRKVRFMHDDVKNRRRYEQHFECGIEFGATHNEAVFPIEQLTVIPPRSDPEIFSIMSERCRALNRRLGDEEKFKERVERALLTSGSGAWSIDAIASRLHVSTRTLKRKLNSEGTNFTLLINQIREGLAKEYLSHTQWKVDAIALELGYSSGSNFGQAFKQWVGLTPSEYREQGRVGEAHD